MPINPTDTVEPGFTINAITPIVLSIDPSRGENGAPGAPGQSMEWRGTWQTGVSYDAYDAVSRSGASYIAVVGNLNVDPATDNGSIWGVLSSPGATGPQGPAGTQYRGAWSATTAYIVNDLVTEHGNTYIAVAPSTNIDPGTDNGTHWQVFAAAGGGGDMYKSVYDTNNNNIVDKAESVPWTGVTGAPVVGDMLKSVYDTNNDGIVDKAAQVPWSGITNAPVAMPPTAHAATHIPGAADPIALAGTTAGGLLNRLTGLTTDYVGGDNACHSLPPGAPIANQTQAGLMNILSGNATDYVGGDNACHPHPIRTRDVNGLAPGFSQRLQLHDDCSYPMPVANASAQVTVAPIPWYFLTTGGSIQQLYTCVDAYNKCYGVFSMGCTAGTLYSVLTPPGATLLAGLGALDLYFRVAFSPLPTAASIIGYFFGISDGVNTSNNSIRLGLSWYSGAAAWQGSCVLGGTVTATTAATSPPPLAYANTALTFFTLRVSINAAWNSVTFYVNGVNIGTITTGIFTVPRPVYLWIYESSSASGSATVVIDDVVVDYQFTQP